MMMNDKPRVGDDEAEDGLPDDADIDTNVGTQVAGGGDTRRADDGGGDTR